MKQGRDKRIAEEIRREASAIVNFELDDPRIVGVIVMGVKVTADLGLARIYYSLSGKDAQKASVDVALKKSIGFVRKELASRIRMKYIPQIEFFYDESFELEDRIQKIFSELPQAE